MDQTRQDLVTAHVRRAIMTGQLHPGDRLIEQTLAAAKAGNASAARSYYTKLVELTAGSQAARPEIAEAKAYLQASK